MSVGRNQSEDWYPPKDQDEGPSVSLSLGIIVSVHICEILLYNIFIYIYSYLDTLS